MKVKNNTTCTPFFMSKLLHLFKHLLISSFIIYNNLFRSFSTDITFISSITWYHQEMENKMVLDHAKFFKRRKKIISYKAYIRWWSWQSQSNSTHSKPFRYSNQKQTMIHPKKLIEMARRWHKKITDKGHFVVYTIDGERFMIPLSYLNSKIFEELLKMSEDEFGLSNDGPIVLPCDASLVKHMISLMRRHNSQEMERELIEFLTSQTNQNPLFLPNVGLSQQEAVYWFWEISIRSLTVWLNSILLDRFSYSLLDAIFSWDLLM